MKKIKVAVNRILIFNTSGKHFEVPLKLQFPEKLQSSSKIIHK